MTGTTPPIRRYAPETDLETCIGIWRRASRAGHPFLSETALEGDEALVREVYMPSAEVWVGCPGGAPAGFVALLGGTVGGLFVAPEHHGRGLGRALVLHAARLHGALDVEVYEANEGARRFYAALGFARTGRRESDDRGRPFPLVAMRRAGPAVE